MIAETLKTEAGQRQHYAAVKARLDGRSATARAAEAARVRRAEIASEDAERMVLVHEAFETPPQRINSKWRQIIAEVAFKHDVTALDIMSWRRGSVIAARQEAWWRIRQETTMSIPQIGRLVQRDHSTLCWGMKQHERRMRGEIK